MIKVPTELAPRLKLANELVEQCSVSLGERSHYCRLMKTIADTGRSDGRKSLINTIYKHLDRTAAHLFSPVELKFSLDFENMYPKTIYDQGAVVAKSVTRQWNRQRTDKRFARGVFDALLYGCALHKQTTQLSFNDEITYHDRLVMPWQFGVYNEGECEINEQICLMEINTITMPEVWRRIWHMPDARKLYDRILSHASTRQPIFAPESFFHQVLSSSQINTGVQQATRPLPGGIVQLGNDPNFSIAGPRISTPTVNIYELWVKDEEDYTTIQLVEPDIIITRYKNENLLGQRLQLQPYRPIRPNETTNWFWGRPEIVDLIEPQWLLSEWCEDTRRMYGLQVDKILAFVGQTGMTAERYGQFRTSGWANLDQGSDVKDLTPKIPDNGLPMLKFLMETISILGGFPPILQGQGEPGVRAGTHADKLTKNASPTLRDRALIVESQCEDAADLTLALREAKDEKFYWTQGDTEESRDATHFLMSQLPADWRVTVDSHSSSPIFSDENQQLVFAAHQRGIVDGDYVIDNVPLPNKEAAKVSLKQKQAAQQQQMKELLQTNPELGEKVMLKQITGGKR